jgi:cell division transport system permease protein
VLSTAIALAFVGTAILLDREISNFRHDYEAKLNVSLYLCPKPVPGQITTGNCRTRYTEAQKADLQRQFAQDPIVKSVTFISEADQVARFRKTVPAKTAQLTEVGDLPASFTVHLRDIKSDFPRFVSEYGKQPGVSATSSQSSVLKTLLKMIDGARLVSIVTALLVLLASILLIGNTIQVAAAQRKNETSIMRLVGASRWMTELPFMIETIVATFVGGLIALGFISLGKQFVLNGIFKSQVEKNVIPNLGANDILVAGGLGIIGGVLVAALTAFATLRLYVKL